jgi:hypothetical protein
LEPGRFDFLLRLGDTATHACPELRRGCAPGSSCGGVCAPGLRPPLSCVCRLARPQTLIQGLACGFQNEAAFAASIQVPLDLTFHARRELPFQIPANQMDGIPTGHSCPTSSGPAWVGPFSSPQRAIRPAEKLFKLEHSGFAFVPLLLSAPSHVAACHPDRSGGISLLFAECRIRGFCLCGLLTFPSFPRILRSPAAAKRPSTNILWCKLRS